MQFRWTGCAQAQVLTFRLVDIASVAASEPPETHRVTRAERDAILRHRAAGAQLRTSW